MEGLPGQGQCPLQADDARRRRVHPPLSTSCPTDFTASVTTASSPMATGLTTLHWLAGCSAHQTQLAGAPTPIAPTVVTNPKSAIFVLAAVGAWSSSRPSHPAASRDCGPFQQSPSTAHDQHASAPSHIAALV